MKYNEDSDSPIAPSNYFLRKIIKSFQMDELVDVGNIRCKGLASSALNLCSHGLSGLTQLLDHFFDHQPLQFVQLYSSQVNLLTRKPSSTDIQFMPLLYVLKYRSGTFLILSTHLQTLSTHLQTLPSPFLNELRSKEFKSIDSNLSFHFTKTILIKWRDLPFATIFP
jgi:hypothetical protein